MNHPDGYDAKQAAAVLTRCLRCFREFYMTQKPAPDHCIACREKPAEWAGYPLTWGDEG